MDIPKVIAAGLMTPFAFLLLIATGIFFCAIIAEFGEDILGVGFLLGWLAFIFSVIYKLLK